MGIRARKPVWRDPQMQRFGVPLRSCLHYPIHRIGDLLNRGLLATALARDCADRTLTKSGVGVEKLPFRINQPKFGGYKMPWNPRRSLIRHPRAILFSPI